MYDSVLYGQLTHEEREIGWRKVNPAIKRLLDEGKEIPSHY